MASLINEKVTHMKFGQGIIIGKNESHLAIQFDSFEAEKVFIYPDAFEKFIVFSKPSLQKKAMELVNEVAAEREAAKEAKKLEDEHLKEESEKERLEKSKKQRKTSKAKVAKKKTVKNPQQDSL